MTDSERRDSEVAKRQRKVRRRAGAGSIGVIFAAVVLASLGPAWRAAHEALLRSLRDL